MKRIFLPALVALLAAAGPAASEMAKPAPAKEEAQSPPRLNLKLEDPARGRARIQFGPRESAGAPAPSDLPSLGGSARPIEPPPGRPWEFRGGGTPFPKDTETAK